MKKIVCADNYVGFLCAVHAYFTGGNGTNSGHENESGTPNGNTRALANVEKTIVNEKHDRNFLDEYVFAPEDVETARTVRRGLENKGGKEFYCDFADGYRSGNPNKEEILLNYLKLFTKHGRAAFSMYDRAEVVAFGDIVRKVRGEAHLLCGFVRFMETASGVYYGFFSADNDILEILTRDFVHRFNAQSFVLHDYKRQKIAVWDGQSLEYLPVESGVEIELSDCERVFQSIWKQYHKNVSIKERANPRLQRQFCPKKYRHFMHEF
ncbi:MAG: TIGR03915 family putative DNA repair protein [Firmicutes bacterium]|nr:TIGR03915 family putative DNA repair protein [Bacillota bacterium]